MDAGADREPNNIFWFNGPDDNIMTAALQFPADNTRGGVNYMHAYIKTYHI